MEMHLSKLVLYMLLALLPLIKTQHVSITCPPDSDAYAQPVPKSAGCHNLEGGAEIASDDELTRRNNPRSVSTERDITGSEYIFGTCTEVDYYNWYYNDYDLKCRYLMGNRTFDEEKYFVYCDNECGVPYLEFLSSCGPVGELYADYYQNLCHMNSNGVPCAFFYLATSYLQPAYYVVQNCPLPQTNGTSCSLECFVSLYQMKYQMGCCVNSIYNYSSLENDLAAYSLWNKCGVATPGVCSGAGSLVLSNLTLILVFFVGIRSVPFPIVY